MIGIVLISHGDMAEGLRSSASMLYPNLEQLHCLSLAPEDNPDEFQARLEEAIRHADTGDGAFILCDLMGGTPCNRAMGLLGAKVRMLSGMSLPMLLTLLSAREDSSDFDAIAEEVLDETSAATMDVNLLLKKKGLFA